jgi:hypothetical protein
MSKNFEKNKQYAIILLLMYVAVPVIIEIILSLLVIGLYFGIFTYLLTQQTNQNIFQLVPFLYLSLGLAYTIYFFFKQGTSIPKLLLQWNIFVGLFTIKNPKKVILLLVMITLILILSQKNNLTNISQFDLLQARLESVNSSLQSVNTWTRVIEYTLDGTVQRNQKSNNSFSQSLKKFAIRPEPTILDSNYNNIDNLLTEFYQLLKHIDSRTINITEFKYSLSEQTSIIIDNEKQLLDIRNGYQTICQPPKEPTEIIDKCTIIKNQTLNLQKLIGSTKESLLELEKKISIISDLDNSNNIISPELRVLWQQELEKRRKFNADRADEWLNKAAISIDYVSKLITSTQENNSLLPNQLKLVSDDFEVLKQKYNEINTKIINRNRKLQNVNNKSILKSDAEKDAETLILYPRKITEIENQLQFLSRSVEKSYTDLVEKKSYLNQLKGGGYTLLIQAKNSSNNRYIDLLNQKSDIDSLYTKVEVIIQETRTIQSNINTEGRRLSSEIGSLKSLAENITSQNNRVIEEIESAIFNENIYAGTIVLIVMLGVAMLVIRQRQKSVINDINKIKNERLVLHLLPIIEDSKTFQDVRLYAINILYKLELPSQEEVSLIKNTVIKLENLGVKDNTKIIARLRKVAMDLEMRLTERRTID